MSTAVAERLESLVTREPPPCEVMVYGQPCGKPSVHKLSRTCSCGIKSTRYVCEDCYFNLIVGEVYCTFCLSPVTGWKFG